jgi:hypothetical protein
MQVGKISEMSKTENWNLITKLHRHFAAVDRERVSQADSNRDSRETWTVCKQEKQESTLGEPNATHFAYNPHQANLYNNIQAVLQPKYDAQPIYPPCHSI